MLSRLLPVSSTLLLLCSLSSCIGSGDDEARAMVEQFRDALVESDSAALRELIGGDRYAVRLDLLTDEVLAESAFADQEIEIESDVDRFNGYADYTLRVDDAVVTLGLDTSDPEITPTDLGLLTIQAPVPPQVVSVNGVTIELDQSDPESTGDPYAIPPGEWTIAAPESDLFDVTEAKVDLIDLQRDPKATADVVYELTAAGEAEAVRQADAYLAACSGESDDPSQRCGGGSTEVCVGGDTLSETTFEPEPTWIIADELRLVTEPATIDKTATTTCRDRDTGALETGEPKTQEATFAGTIQPTPDGLTVTFD